MSKELEPGVIVDIPGKHQSKVRKLFQFTSDAQFVVLEVAKRTKWQYAMVRVAATKTDIEGHWLWKRHVHRVASKKIRPEWTAA